VDRTVGLLRYPQTACGAQIVEMRFQAVGVEVRFGASQQQVQFAECQQRRPLDQHRLGGIHILTSYAWRELVEHCRDRGRCRNADRARLQRALNVGVLARGAVARERRSFLGRLPDLDEPRRVPRMPTRRRRDELDCGAMPRLACQPVGSELRPGPVGDARGDADMQRVRLATYDSERLVHGKEARIRHRMNVLLQVAAPGCRQGRRPRRLEHGQSLRDRCGRTGSHVNSQTDVRTIV
jgi:hypothetical protein